MMVGEEQQGQNNKYFDILINTAPKELAKITVMKLGLTTNFKEMKATNLHLIASSNHGAGKWFSNQRCDHTC